MTDNDLLALEKEIEDITLALNAPSREKVMLMIITYMNKRKNTNSITNSAEVSGVLAGEDNRLRSIQRYVKRLSLSSRIADVKNSTRFKAFDNIRNPISLCAVLYSIYGLVDPELVFSSDDVSVLLNEWSKPEVLTTKAAAKILDEQNIGVSVVEDRDTRRVVAMNITISALGMCPCKIIKIADRNFTEYRETPLLFRMEPDLFLMLYHPDCDAKKVNYYQYNNCICPCVRMLRDQAINRDNSGLAAVFIPLTDYDNHTEFLLPSDEQTENFDVLPDVSDGYEERVAESSCSSMRVDASRPTPALVVLEDMHELATFMRDKSPAERFEWIVLACDGAYAQIQALLCLLNEQWIQKGYQIVLLKYAGGCSMSQSSNDVGKMHSILQSCFRSVSFRYDGTNGGIVHDDPPGQQWAELKTFLSRYLDTASHRTIWRYLKHASGFLAKAFQVVTIQSAFRTAGVYPLRTDIILSRNQHFRSLPDNEADFLMASVPALGNLVTQQGRLVEGREQDDYERVLGPHPGIDKCPVKLTGKCLDDMAVVRGRAMVMNNQVLLAHQQKLYKDKVLVNQRRKAKREEQEAVRLRKKRLLYSASADAEDDGSQHHQNLQQEHPAAKGEQSEEELPAKKARVTKKTRCSTSDCRREKPQGQFKKIGWLKCIAPGCGLIFCDMKKCREAFGKHKTVCM